VSEINSSGGVGCVAGAGVTGAADGVAAKGFTFAGVAGAAPVVLGEVLAVFAASRVKPTHRGPQGLSREAIGRTGFQRARTMRTMRTVAPPTFLARQKAGLS
jgi:hypothetical protein